MAGVKFKELFFHMFSFALFLYTLRLNLGTFIPGSTDSYGGRFKYLTFLCLCIQIGYYLFSLVVDIRWMITYRLLNQPSDLELRKTKRETYDSFVFGRFSFRRTRDYWFCTLVFPISLIVTVFFWGLYGVSPNTVMSPLQRQYIHPHGFYNHAVHTGPLTLSVLEALITFHVPPSKKRKGVGVVCIFGSLYLAWVFWIASKADIWVYPFLAKMRIDGMVLFFIGVYTTAAAAYFTGIFLTSYYWRRKLIEVFKRLDCKCR